MTPDLWFEAHSYLRPLADLSAQVDCAAAGIDVPDACIPDWEDYRADFLAGVPLLPSTAAAVDLEPGGRMAGAILERLASGTSSGRLAAEIRALDTALRREPQVSRRLADFLLGDETLRPPFPGLLRYLAWTATARFLRPVVNAFDGWRDEEQWLRRYCPTCGSRPRWPNWSASTPGAGACSRAAAAARAGDTRELGAPSAKVRTTIGSPPWRSREKYTFASTTASSAGPISKLMMGRGARPSFWRIGLRFTST